MSFCINDRDRKVMTEVLKKVTVERHQSFEDMANRMLDELFARHHILIDADTYHDLEVHANTHGLSD